jgi:1-deoxy-D-xylulose-5-phosphate synthase
MTLPDAFQAQDKTERLYAAAGLDAKAIVAKALSVFGAGAVAASRTGRA